MTPLMDWVVRPSVVLALTFAITVLLKSRSAALRHCVLTAAVVTAGVIAPLSSVVPTWNVTIPQTSDVATLSGSTTEAATAVASHTRQSEVPTTAAILVVVWLIGLVFNLSRIAVSLVGLGLVAARAEPVEENRWRMSLAAVSSRLQITRPVRSSRPRDVGTPPAVCRGTGACIGMERRVDPVPALPRARTRSARRLVRQSPDRCHSGRALVQPVLLAGLPSSAPRK